ncbi:class I SAM-dependent methyltransferase [Roseibacterium sp. SDUM158017]|uniref:class I SAM-dependent DNA methyltransferase n=1 Tax=Roseicyclus salinarum TaxID=3036773 RepID=UPI0024152062|nr:class I SAM-dependent methyltransferase [Roseibacterium sp. SDUM158017]MDG4647026.1 class I SAM-dependent methyltransferase [Roseibacterium sp. SDUM158017]
MKLKSVELDATALMSEVMFGHGYAHYGYFPDGAPEVLSAQAVGAAQQAYLEKLVEAIGTVPGGVGRILDVGSGTGANARALIERGFDVACVSPSSQMNEMARAKLPEGTAVTDAYFETFESGDRFDLCLFAESFHYIELAPALRQAARYAGKGVVIFDYFRRAGHEHRDGTRGTHAAFLEEVARQGAFEILSDEDMTQAITPTFVIHEHIKNEKVAPFVRRFRDELRREYPWRAWALDKLFGRTLDKLGRKTGRSESFARVHEYRLIVMRRTGGEA